MSTCILSKRTGDSDMILLNDCLTLTYLVNKGHKKIHWAKESFGSLMDAHVIVL